MTPKTTKPRCVLLDANIVIEAYTLEIWAELKDRYELILPSVVVINEVKYFRSSRRGSRSIRLGEQTTRGEVHQLTATAEEYAEIYKIFDSVFLQALDPGETEALALLWANRIPEAFFCTSDAPAIKALAMLGLSQQGISMEMLMSKIGLARRLETQFTEDFFKTNIRHGQIARIKGEGLINPI
jgi:hypothetical protein